MARPTVPAGFGSGFNPDVFREAIRATMVMGLPNSVPERATFRWRPEKVYNVDDPAGNPYDLTATPTTSETHADIQVPVAVEFSARPAGSMDTVIGEFDTSRVVITILDVDFAEIQGADEVLLGGENTYDIQFVGPPMGLFEVTVYQVFAIARDESS